MDFHSSNVYVIARTQYWLGDLKSFIAVGSHLSPSEIVGVSPLDPARFKRSARLQRGKTICGSHTREDAQILTPEEPKTYAHALAVKIHTTN